MNENQENAWLDVYDLCVEKGMLVKKGESAKNAVLRFIAAQQSVHPTAFWRGLVVGWSVTSVVFIVYNSLFGGG